MQFVPIHIASWSRREHYRHFLNEVVCSYAVTVTLDITPLKGQRLYPAMLWLLTKAVHRVPEFRTAFRNGVLGIYDTMQPAYTIFNQEQEIFTSLWTEYDDHYKAFLHAYTEDVAKYSQSTRYIAKANRPDNSFDVSMMPWLDFTAFNLNVHNGGRYLLPIFTIGKYKDKEGKRFLPLAIQVHHAVCDGYHVAKFVKALQEEIERFPRHI